MSYKDIHEVCRWVMIVFESKSKINSKNEHSPWVQFYIFFNFLRIMTEASSILFLIICWFIFKNTEKRCTIIAPKANPFIILFDIDDSTNLWKCQVIWLTDLWWSYQLGAIKSKLSTLTLNN